ncbi:MAG: UDP-N-acetylmuramoyl-L-alanyl-D-glutamate--2,6-diaminopimelate ligase [Candidatus Pacebacteria bacterium]|nr:UDP-N-acetylmuramoyl-L-alanyl-D-glutamate--2,6-diaminopimelate ligase [Candidatus Paceibacterota bacterium]
MMYKIKSAAKKIVPYSLILSVHKAKAIYASYKYGFPSRKLKIIAVAGTKGKTTTTNMIARILEGSGHKVAMLSTANFQIDKKKWLNDVKLTTPSAAYVQDFLDKAVEAGCEYAILEASSHGMVQSRYWGINFQTVIVTNLTSDHLDYHKTFENYKSSHYGLIGEGTKNLIINYDEPNTHELLVLKGDLRKIVFTLKDISHLDGMDLVRAENVKLGEAGSSFDLLMHENKYQVTLPLLGEFNVYNALGAILACQAEGVPVEDIVKNLAVIGGIPGRMEKIDEGQDFEVIVDYAHSPESLQNVYSVLRPRAKGKMIAVLGGTGDRDKTYRARGGELADKFADIVIVTNEDPYSEEVEDIIDQMMSGIRNKKLDENLFRITDRKEAMRKAFELARPGDLVIITGKGCEQFMIFGDKKIPWDDREVARELLKGNKPHS